MPYMYKAAKTVQKSRITSSSAIAERQRDACSASCCTNKCNFLPVCDSKLSKHRVLSAIAELLVYFCILSFDVNKDNNNNQGSKVKCSVYYMTNSVKAIALLHSADAVICCCCHYCGVFCVFVSLQVTNPEWRPQQNESTFINVLKTQGSHLVVLIHMHLPF